MGYYVSMGSVWITCTPEQLAEFCLSTDFNDVSNRESALTHPDISKFVGVECLLGWLNDVVWADDLFETIEDDGTLMVELQFEKWHGDENLLKLTEFGFGIEGTLTGEDGATWGYDIKRGTREIRVYDCVNVVSTVSAANSSLQRTLVENPGLLDEVPVELRADLETILNDMREV